MKHEILLFITC